MDDIDELLRDELGCVPGFLGTDALKTFVQTPEYPEDKQQAWALRDVPTDRHTSAKASHDKDMGGGGIGRVLSSLLPNLPHII